MRGGLEDSLEDGGGEAFVGEELGGFVGWQGGPVGAGVGEGVPDVAGGDQGGEGREGGEACGVAVAVFALVVVVDAWRMSRGQVGQWWRVRWAPMWGWRWR